MLADGYPLIGISGRGKRLDKVLFTILHEVSHVLLGHLNDEKEIILDDLSAESLSQEKEADLLASTLAIPQLPPYPRNITNAWIQEKSIHLDIHPIVLIGRLQKEGAIPWKTSLSRNAPTVTPYLRRWECPLP